MKTYLAVALVLLVLSGADRSVFAQGVTTTTLTRASRYLEYMDNRVMVAVGILENFIAERIT